MRGKYKSNSYNAVYRRMNKNTFYGTNPKEITYNQIKGCLSKIGYDTEFESAVVAAKQRLRNYKCKYCNHWHLTKVNKEGLWK